MAAGTKTDFKIYNEQYYAGYYEVQQQNVDAFNSASNGMMTLVTERMKGDFEQEAFIKRLAGLVQRRDVTSVADVADKKLEMDEFVGVKLNRRIGPVAQTGDAFRKVASDPEEMSFILGQMAAGDEAAEQLNTTIAALAAALAGQASLLTDKDATVIHQHLSEARGKMGDAFGRLNGWIMHSKVFHDLIGQSIADKIDSVAGVTIYQGTTGTLGLPTIVTDSPSLVIADGGGVGVDEYYTMGLVDNAAMASDSEERDLIFEKISGKENILYRYQAEMAYNIRLKGLSWDMTNGGVNPSAAAIATGANWLKKANDIKDLPGVILRTR